MIKIFICEDNLLQRETLKDNISFEIDELKYSMFISLSTDNPLEIISELKTKPVPPGIYILDINLNHTVNGIDLAKEIRKYDKSGKIIFLTSHDEYLLAGYKNNIEAFDYIIKTSIENTENVILDTLKLAYSEISDVETSRSKFFKVTIANQIQLIPLNEILFFVTTPIPHKIDLHYLQGQLSFYGTLSNILINDSDFIRCHRSYLVNINNMATIDKTQRVLIMKNGETCLCSYLGMKKILSFIKHSL